MRNWNCYPRWSWPRWSSRFGFTYEELKHIQTIPRLAEGGLFRIYLWGIETHLGWPCCDGEGNVSDLPMRNWNPDRAVGNGDGGLGFGFTYEELKLIEATLEVGFSAGVSDLPMRNWNHHRKEGRQLQVKGFRIYLWGIETKADRIDWTPDWAGFGFTYEELKPSSKPTYSPAKYLFRIYLWGIETRWLNYFSSLRTRFRIYLWGIETGIEQVNNTINRLVSDLPMRNWNYFATSVSKSVIEVSDLPMRNWNSRSVPQQLPENICFGFTYEELKRNCYGVSPIFLNFEFRIYLWGIETRGQRLESPVFRGSFRIYLWGIETGVILDCNFFCFKVSDLPMRNWNMNRFCQYSFSGSYVSDLPMRNWNFEIPLGKWTNHRLFRIYLWGIETEIASNTRFVLCAKFRIYLWGIETPFSGWPVASRPHEFRIYLWGIETSAFVPWLPLVWQVSDLPMRNWNGTAVYMTQQYQAVFRIYLWGIETTIPFHHDAQRMAAFRIYLWGIETPILMLLRLIVVHGFGFTYEELKLHSVT